MAVHAHPDDESSKAAATLARYAARGVDVLVVTCTGGEAGDIINPAMDRPEVRRRLPQVRREELAAAVQILGVRQQGLGFVDSGWPGGDPPPPLPPGTFAALPLSEAVAPLVAAVRDFRPHVMITYDERGGYPHPDHIRAHEISRAAFTLAADGAAHPLLGSPWQASKLYYVHEWCGAKMRVLHDALIAQGLPSPYHDWLREWTPERDVTHRITTRVPCADFFDRRDDALRAHRTQIDPDSHWFAVPLALQRELWPTEEFELVSSVVPTSLPEDDLFAGIDVDAVDGSATAIGPTVPRPAPGPGPVPAASPQPR
ncbi:mycothiol conjugate amidase Mca [Micromonospora coxensis]|uniref:mycothiol conjugate amidase Mca n=1 Tax=Micromonospora coxensis TaxID=356852 RepID=UPI00341AD7C6